MVHRADNLAKLVEMLKNGHTIESAALYFCGHCGEYTAYPPECGCGSYSRQYPSAE